jgi:hypothetical protein
LAPATGQVRHALGLPVDGPLIGSVGRWTEQKGYRHLLLAHRSLPAGRRGRPGAGPSRAGGFAGHFGAGVVPRPPARC